jgi:hypothetical protein
MQTGAGRFDDDGESEAGREEIAELAHVISLWYSDMDMPNGSVFETIVRRIGQSDFCIFDDRETEARPNVLIERGVAIGMNKPYCYLNYSATGP